MTQNSTSFHFSDDLERDVKRLKASSLPEQRDIAQAIMNWHSQDEFTFMTSGSTGKAKSIKFSKDQVIASIKQSQVAFNLSSSDTVLLSLPMRYVAGKMMLYRALYVGMNVICAEPKMDLSIFIGENVSFAAFVPQQIENLLRISEGRNWLESIRVILVGGAGISASLESALTTFSNDIYHTYGMTETLTHIAIRQLSEGGSSSFKTLPHVQIELRPNGALSLLAKHLNVKVNTTDRVQIITKDTFKVLGRLDNVINSGGLKISPEELEPTFKKYLQKEVVIIGIPDDEWGEKVALVVESEEPCDPEWIQAAKDEIPKAKWPKLIHYLNELPRTESGKVKRKKISITP